MNLHDFNTFPVVGELTPNLLSLIYPELESDIGFYEYLTDTMRGLAKIDGDQIELLVIVALLPQCGNGGRFLAACQAEYRVVTVWAVSSDILQGMLERRGYVPISKYDGGALVHGYRWERV